MREEGGQCHVRYCDKNFKQIKRCIWVPAAFDKEAYCFQTNFSRALYGTKVSDDLLCCLLCSANI